MKKTISDYVPEWEQDAALEFATDMIKTMHVAPYTVLIMKKPAPSDAIAMVRTVSNRHVAQLYLCKDWSSRSIDVRRNTLVHECLHIWHRGLSDFWDDEVERELHYSTVSRLGDRWTNEVELMVDNLANFISDTHTVVTAFDEIMKRRKEQHDAEEERANTPAEVPALGEDGRAGDLEDAGSEPERAGG